MRNFRNALLALAALAALTVPLGWAGAAWAQMGRGMGGGPPQIPGIFKPSVGEGSEYQMTTKDGTMDIEYAVVGKETVDGQDGYWNETRIKGGKGGGTVMKTLMVTGGDNPGIKRMIVQAPGQEPMEMPMGMMSGMMKSMAKSAPQQSGKESAAPMGEKVGTEMITVPAGTFLCDHYKSKSDNGGDVWISTKVYPYGLVKMVSKDSTIVLQKTLSDQTSEIKGEPKKMEMPHF